MSGYWILLKDGIEKFRFNTDQEANDFMDELGSDDHFELAYVSGV